jgi:hypothetical protein
MLALISFTSCSNSEEKSELVPISEASHIGDDSVNDYKNLKISNNFEINMPDLIGTVSEFTVKYMEREENKDFYDSFNETLNYLFKDHKINSKFLYYYGENSFYEVDNDGNLVNDLNRVEDKYDSIMSGNEDVLYFLYDETWDSSVSIDSPVCAAFTSPICNDLSKFYKGEVLNYIDDHVDLESLQIKSFFPVESSEDKNSENKYKLEDKEISVSDAVEFFENYINSIPCKADSSFKMSVYNADVLKLDSNNYGLFFNTTLSYNGLQFDSVESGSFRQGMEDYNFIIGEGFMLKSYDVDYAYGIYRDLSVSDEETYEKIVSVEEAVESLSNNLTNTVIFDLNKIELVYLEKNSDSVNSDVSEKYLVSPYWKFTLYNENDNLTYCCYVNSLDSDEFLYYTKN